MCSPNQIVKGCTVESWYPIPDLEYVTPRQNAAHAARMGRLGGKRKRVLGYVDIINISSAKNESGLELV